MAENTQCCRFKGYEKMTVKELEVFKQKENEKADTEIIFGGRLGEYKYYDMDKVIEAAMLRFEKENI